MKRFPKFSRGLLLLSALGHSLGGQAGQSPVPPATAPMPDTVAAPGVAGVTGSGAMPTSGPPAAMSGPDAPGVAQPSVPPASEATQAATPAAPPAASDGEPSDAAARARARRTRPAATQPDLAPITAVAPKLSDTDVRRNSTAAKMVFGREELDRYGDTSVGEVLKRLPGITISGTPGRGGDIRMRGLGNGYTLILINGEPVPRGFSIDSLSPEQIERIEISRAPVAEHSARAIAGTINIVLREEFVRRSTEIRPVLGYEGGRVQEQVALQHDDRVDHVDYSVTANLIHRELPSQSVTDTDAVDARSGAPVLVQHQQDHSLSVTNGVNANARVNWRLAPGDSLSFQPFLSEQRTYSLGNTQLDQTVGGTPAPYADADFRTDSTVRIARGIGNLKLKFQDGGALELRFNAGVADSASQTGRIEDAAGGALAHVDEQVTDINDTSLSMAGKYSHPLPHGQDLAVGWELESGHRQETAYTLQDGLNPLSKYGDEITAQTLRYALYAQDEWNISPLWATYGGLRYEHIGTNAGSALGSDQNDSSVLSPLLHSVWRFSPDGKDQVRAAVTRSYRAPTLANLVPIPTLSTIYPAYESNTAVSPDSVGNPGLKPELAWGYDLAIEHYFAQGGLLSASAFLRNIDDLIRSVTTLQTVNYSPVQRWVSNPTNFGHASTHGIELEAKFRLDELIPAAPPRLSVNTNYTYFWSNVEDVPGPNNRLDQQPHATANLGGDYRMTSLPLTFGGNYNYTSSFIVASTATQIYYQGIKRVADLYTLWKIDRQSQLRVSLSNATHVPYETANQEVFGTTSEVAQQTQKTYPSISMRYEIRL